jgi:tetratricopeptide (TPR) repeat protein
MNKNSKKILSSFQLMSVVAVLFALGAFVLISSGLFDSADAKVNQHTHSQNNPPNSNNPSVDLNAINEINRLEQVVKSSQQNHEALLKLGHLLNDNGFHERAIDKYETYLKTHSDNADVIVDMGVCYFELKKYDKAINVIKSALVINPIHQIANFNLGIVNLANSNPAEARQWWQKARDIDPNTNIGKKAEELLKSNN